MTKRRGRPKLAEHVCKMSLLLPCDVYDRVYEASRKSRVSVPDVIRHAIQKLLADERGASLSL